MQTVNKKIAVSIMGATGLVGQNFIRLMENHPWFTIVDLAASERSAGKLYAEAVADNWLMKSPIPDSITRLHVRNAHDFAAIPPEVRCVFSALDLGDKSSTREFEYNYARKGYAVVSTSSANRQTEDVPMIIPEINPQHCDIIPLQQKNRQFPPSGFVAVKPNCSIQSYIVVLDALRKGGYSVDKVQVTTLQALSGAGIDGLTNPDLRENVIPFINGEEEKTENEPLKIFGRIEVDGIVPATDIKISAVCTRVPVIEGHMAIVHLSFSKDVPTLAEFKSILLNYTSAPQQLGLPSAPAKPIIVVEEFDKPQPKFDADSGNGMAVTIGRISEDTFFDLRFIGLSHNTVRGAAGGALLTAELLKAKGYIF